MMAVLQDSG
jgi:hypothetical protein